MSCLLRALKSLLLALLKILTLLEIRCFRKALKNQFYGHCGGCSWQGSHGSSRYLYLIYHKNQTDISKTSISFLTEVSWKTKKLLRFTQISTHTITSLELQLDKFLIRKMTPWNKTTAYSSESGGQVQVIISSVKFSLNIDLEHGSKWRITSSTNLQPQTAMTLPKKTMWPKVMWRLWPQKTLKRFYFSY